MMLEIFQYGFMQRAFITGLFIALITPAIGVIVVLRGLSMIGDSLSHSSLAGVAAGLIAGINPVAGAVTFSVLAALGIERVRKSFPQYSEIAIAVIMSTGIGLAGVLSGYVKSSVDFNSFLFGSIVAISNFELIFVIILSIIVILFMILLYKELFYITFDEESARLSGIPVNTINFIFTIMIAVSISVSSRTVGTLVVSSMMVLPVASALQIAKSYRQTYVYSMILGLVSTFSGLYISYYAETAPGGTIVLVNVLILVIILIYKNVIKVLMVKNAAGCGEK